MLKRYNHHSYQLYTEDLLRQEDIESIIHGVEQEFLDDSKRVLSGRGTIRFSQLTEGRKIAIKTYLRGGVFGKLIRRFYFRCGEFRPQIEYQALLIANRCGIAVPKPIAFLIKGYVFYQAWLVMDYLPHRDNLANIAKNHPDQAERLMPQVCDCLNRLVSNMIFHPDLHPGNLLVSDQDQIFIIDFDKAGIFSGPPSKLQEMYLLRWRRAVIKHNLPDFMAEYVSASLRSKNLDESNKKA